MRTQRAVKAIISGLRFYHREQRCAPVWLMTSLPSMYKSAPSSLSIENV